MLAGKKPLASFGDFVGSEYEVPEADFAPQVADGTFVRREVVYRSQGPLAPGRYVYFARADEEWRIEAIHQIHERLFVRGESTSPEIEREIGRLLGYAEADIEQYIAWVEAFRTGRR